MKINEQSFKTMEDLSSVTTYFMKNVNRIITPFSDEDQFRAMVILFDQMLEQWHTHFDKNYHDILALTSSFIAVVLSASRREPKDVAFGMVKVFNKALEFHLNNFYKEEIETKS